MGRITFTQLESLTSGNFLVGDASGDAAQVTPTGDVTFDNAGLFAITAGVIVNADVSTVASILESKLLFDTGTGHNHDGTNSRTITGATELWDETPSGTVNNTNKLFTLASAPITQSLMLFLNGVKLQRVATAASRNEYEHVSAATIITLGKAAKTGDSVEVNYTT